MWRCPDALRGPKESMTKRIARIATATLVAFAACGAGAPHAEHFPVRVVKIMVGYPPGSSADILTRIYAQKLSERFAQQFVIENRPGASGGIAAEATIRAAGDGYTLLMATVSNSIGASAHRNIKYSLTDDFAALALVAEAPNILVAQPSFGANSVTELVALAKAHPNQVLYGSAGTGSSPHLAGELFNYLSGAGLVHVPYRGVPAALVDLLGGRLAVVFATAPAVAGYIADGRLKALASTSSKRASLASDVPTMAEAGLAGYETSIWYGFLAPRGTPTAICETLADALIAINAQPDVQSQLGANGAEPLTLKLDAFAAFIRDDIKKMKVIVDYAGISLE